MLWLYAFFSYFGRERMLTATVCFNLSSSSSPSSRVVVIVSVLYDVGINFAGTLLVQNVNFV